MCYHKKHKLDLYTTFFNILAPIIYKILSQKYFAPITMEIN